MNMNAILQNTLMLLLLAMATGSYGLQTSYDVSSSDVHQSGYVGRPVVQNARKIRVLKKGRKYNPKRTPQPTPSSPTDSSSSGKGMSMAGKAGKFMATSKKNQKSKATSKKKEKSKATSKKKEKSMSKKSSKSSNTDSPTFAASSVPTVVSATPAPTTVQTGTQTVTTSPTSAPTNTPQPTGTTGSPSVIPSDITSEFPSDSPSESPAEAFETTLELSQIAEAFQQAFINAAARWDTVIVGALDPVTVTQQILDTSECLNIPSIIDNVLICPTIEPIDGPNGILGSAGPEFRRSGGSNVVRSCLLSMDSKVYFSGTDLTDNLVTLCVSFCSKRSLAL
jgi:hypothetical protein